MEIRKIYFDMDGVLADFDGGVKTLCRLPFDTTGDMTEEQDDEMWAQIRAVGHFYDKLQPLQGAIEMFWEIYGKYGDKCEILTGIPKPRRGIETAGEDKTSWAHRVLTPKLKLNIVFAEQKKEFCTGPECVLIDDLKKNIIAWESCGGTGVHTKSPADTLRILREKGIL